MNKRGMELSTNFIVILIISMAILAFGIYFINMIFSSVAEQKLALDSQTEAQLERLMDDGGKVVIPIKSKTIAPGDLDTFGIGVLNVLDTQSFSIAITYSDAFNAANQQIDCVSDCPTWILTTSSTTPISDGVIIQQTIGKNQKKKMLLGILPSDNAKPGTYIFDVDVTKQDGVKYDSKHKIYVKIPS